MNHPFDWHSHIHIVLKKQKCLMYIFVSVILFLKIIETKLTYQFDHDLKLLESYRHDSYNKRLSNRCCYNRSVPMTMSHRRS